MARPGRPHQIPRDALHRVLWRRVDRFGRITFNQQDMAVNLEISEYHFSRIMQEGARHGRWSVVHVGQHHVNTYDVVDPDRWAALQAEAG